MCNAPQLFICKFRYRLHFFKESKTEIERRKLEARKTLTKKNEEDLEIDFEEVYQPGSVLDIPIRPRWSYSMSKAKLEANEEKYFQGYLDGIFDAYATEGLSYFEMNLETWRQLWRVLEMSDVILLIVDIRYPVLHFSPVLYSYVTERLHKHVIVVLNKIDLVPASVVTAWKHYLLEKYPYLKVVLFTSFPKEYIQGGENEQQVKAKKKRKKGGRFTQASGARELLRVCEDIVGDKVDLSSWEEKLDMEGSWPEGEGEEESEDEEDSGPTEQEMFKDGVLTLGCVGYPNVGKSSVVNGLVGKKVVSVSRTPGHTKHFQTIYLTSTVKLCDCPGLVFPSLIDKSLQILAGIYPIAQVQEPYTPVGFIGERIDIPSILHLQHPAGDTEWSAYDICEAWAKRRGFITAKASRPDVYRAANNLLRMALDGRLCVSLKPKGYTEEKCKIYKCILKLEIFGKKHKPGLLLSILIHFLLITIHVLVTSAVY
ncbi:hypothetical protein FSP39_016369 [Pinctada imbricata]|uniref:Guanine nucleotide-binding protein-like 1 n=1 Tax=Pinctada imbricata TaxID=66713 RepID=A0AA89BMF1_PINIB|nr:hypothetical protein FSP39_016369 [Pinctada imbricata]